MVARVRRVITADKSGRSSVLSDGQAPTAFTFDGGISVTELWKTHESPCDLASKNDVPEAGAFSLLPPMGGNVLRISDFPPDSDQMISTADAANLFEKMGAGNASTATEDARSALMHRTDTIDYGIVLEGEITMLLDDDEVVLYAGDVVIQRGTNHSWVNKSQHNCRMAFVLNSGVRGENPGD